MKRERPSNYPKLKNYKPTRFMLPTSHYDEAKADRAVKFIEMLCHTKGEYPVIYSLGMDEDWRDEKNWYKVNPSLGYTIKVEGMREACHEAEQNPADEITFRWLRLNQWVGSTIAWIPDSVVMKGQTAVFRDDELRGRKCYGGLDLSSSEDITALALVFPPESEDEKYMLKLFCWVPEDTVPKREKRTGLPYSKWVAQGNLETTPGNTNPCEETNRKQNRASA